MRTFIAVDFPSYMIESIDKVIHYFKKQLPERSIKWVSGEHLHLTIKFIGELPDHKLPEVKNILRNIIGSPSSFEIGIQGLGMYPNPQKPRVIWLGITNMQPLIALHNILDQALADVGIQPEGRKFSPHLTLARIRKQTDLETVSNIGRTLSQFKVDSLGVFFVDQICLYKSILSPQGPIHSSLQKVLLNKV